MPAKVEHSFEQPEPSIFNQLIQPIVVGSVSAAVLATLPVKSVFNLNQTLTTTTDELYYRSVLAVSGLVLGYGGTKCLKWLRRALVKASLTYRGWITHPKSLKTKVCFSSIMDHTD